MSGAGTDAWAAWSERVHSPRWDQTRARYWASRLPLPRRCVWCRRPHNPPHSPLQLNHLTYLFARFFRGWTPLFTFLPMCERCHKVETRWTRRARRWRWVPDELAHGVVTLGVWLATRSVVFGVAYYGWQLIF